MVLVTIERHSARKRHAHSTSILTGEASESALIFRITCPRWAFTVISLIPSSAAT